MSAAPLLTNLDWAQAYAAQGLVVLPLWPGKKVPHASKRHPERSLLGEGFKLDTVGSKDPGQLIDWWAQEPNAGIGIVCGRRSRLLLIDIDTKNSGEWAWESWKAERADEGLVLPISPVVKTPSGGFHLWFLLPEGVDCRLWDDWLPGVDVLGTGHWVAAPPTLVSEHGRAYEFLTSGTIPVVPEWFLTQVTKPTRRRTANSSDATIMEHEFDGERFDWGPVFEGVPIRPGAQNTLLHRAACSCRARRQTDDMALSNLRQVIDCFVNDPDRDPWTDQHAVEMWERVKEEFPAGVGQPLPYRPPQLTLIQGGADEDGRGGEPVDPEEGGGGTDDDDAGPNRNTDRMNAREFQHHFRDEAVWTPEAGWLVWNGMRWATDELQRIKELMERLAERMLMRRTTVVDDEERRTLYARAMRLESSKGLSSTLAYAESMMARNVTDFDKDPWLLNCLNGTVDLRTGVLRPHEPTDLLTRMCPTEYDPEAVDPVWDEFIRVVLPEPQRLVLQRFMGSCLTGVVRDKAFLVPTGPKHTGKSTATEPLLRVLGDVDEGGYATTWDERVVQRGTSVNRDEKANKARAARLVVVGELTRGARFEDSFVKRITGGDTLDARPLYRRSFSFRPQFKLVMHSNSVPKSSDPALHDRLKMLPFANVFENRTDDVKNHLEQSPEAQRAILAWAVQGCVAWQQHGLGEMPWLEEMMWQYTLDSDPVVAWIDECLEQGGEFQDWITADGAWLGYESWMYSQGGKPMKRRTFERALEERGYKRVRRMNPELKTREVKWEGLRLVAK